MIKAIFCDLDGTLFNDDKAIPFSAIEAIRSAESKGIPFIPCTGRLPYTVWGPLKVLDFTQGYLIGANGSLIYKKEEVLHDHPIPVKVSEGLVKIGLSHHAYIHVQKDDFLYYCNRFRPNQDPLSSLCKDVDEEEILRLIDERVYKICLVTKHDQALVKQMHKEIMDAGISCSVFPADYFLEANDIGETKADGIDRICDILKIKPQEVLAIGDGHNDFEMLHKAGFRAAPQNAIDSIKEICDYVSPYDSNHQAIADIITHYLQEEN